MNASGRLIECDPTAVYGPEKRGRRRPSATMSATSGTSSLPMPRTTAQRQSIITNAIAGPSSEASQSPGEATKSRRERPPRKRRLARVPRTVKDSHAIHPSLTHNEFNRPSSRNDLATSSGPGDARQGYNTEGLRPRRTRHSAPYPIAHDSTQWQGYPRLHPYETASVRDMRQPGSGLLPQPLQSYSWSPGGHQRAAEQATPLTNEYEPAAGSATLPAGPTTYSQIVPPRHCTGTSISHDGHPSVQGVSDRQQQNIPTMSSYSSLSGALGEAPVTMSLDPQYHAGLVAPPTPHNTVGSETQYGSNTQYASHTRGAATRGGNLRHHPYARRSGTRRQREVEVQAMPTQPLAQVHWPPLSAPQLWQQAEPYQDYSFDAVAAPYTNQPNILSYENSAASSSFAHHQYPDAFRTTHPTDHAFDYATLQATAIRNEVLPEFLPADPVYAGYEADPSVWAPQVGSSTSASFYAAGEGSQSYVSSMPDLQEHDPSMVGSVDGMSTWNTVASYPPAYDLYSSCLDMLSFDTYRTLLLILDTRAMCSMAIPLEPGWQELWDITQRGTHYPG